MTDKKYNGWTNYATWRVNLEIFDGTEFDHYPTDEELHELAEEIALSDCNPDSLGASYVRAFLSGVNWSEIAQRIIDDAKAEAKNV